MDFRVIVFCLLVSTSPVYSKWFNWPSRDAMAQFNILKSRLPKSHIIPGFSFKILYGLGSYTVEDGEISHIDDIKVLVSHAEKNKERKRETSITLEMEFPNLVVQYKELKITGAGVTLDGYWGTSQIKNRVKLSITNGVTLFTNHVENVTFDQLEGFDLVLNSHCPVNNLLEQLPADIQDYYTTFIEDKVKSILTNIITDSLETVEPNKK